MCNMIFETTDIEVSGTEYAIEAIESVYPVNYETPNDDQSDSDDQFDSLQEYFLITQIDRYFRVNALEQKQMRANLAEAIRNADYVEPCIESILEHVGEKSAQSTISAAIDLLSAVGAPVPAIAMKVLRNPSAANGNALFVLANAVTRRNNSWTATLLRSSSLPVREGAIEALAGHDGFMAKSTLETTAVEDSSSGLRERAKQILEDEF